MKPQAYTYLIGWSKINKWYYGCRHHKSEIEENCSDLWKTYFTSSKIVKYFRLHFGEPDIIQIRKTFDDSKKAIEWETKVLQKFQVCSNNHWLNISDNAGGINPPPNQKGTIWINKNGKNKRISKIELNEYLNQGWVKGRLLGEVKFYKHGNRKRNETTGRYC